MLIVITLLHLNLVPRAYVSFGQRQDTCRGADQKAHYDIGSGNEIDCVSACVLCSCAYAFKNQEGPLNYQKTTTTSIEQTNN